MSELPQHDYVCIMTDVESKWQYGTVFVELSGFDSSWIVHNSGFRKPKVWRHQLLFICVAVEVAERIELVLTAGQPCAKSLGRSVRRSG